MPTPILMPALSPTMTEGTLANWLKKEGDVIRSGDVIAEIETDKATMEVEAVDEGTLGKILIAAGTENVAINTPIAMLLEDGEDASALDKAVEVSAPPPASAEAAPSASAESSHAGRSSPSAPVASGKDRVFASPLARRMAQQAGLDLAGIRGTGPHGRIVKSDIEKAARDGGAGKATAPAAGREEGQGQGQGQAMPAAAVPAALPSTPPERTHREVPLNAMRKVIARRLTESKQQVPHFYLTVDCEIDGLLDLRKQLNGRASANYKLSVNDLVIKTVALAMRAHPQVNAQWGGDRLFQLENIDVSVAVAIEGGLITPIIRDADTKSVAAISNEMKELAGRARENRLQPHEFQGGGFSISNLGMFGIRNFSAVINPPQACILAVGAGEQRPVVRDGQLTIATVMSVTLSVDHRVVDGALAAEWLQSFKGLIEDPLALLL